MPVDMWIVEKAVQVPHEKAYIDPRWEWKPSHTDMIVGQDWQALQDCADLLQRNTNIPHRVARYDVSKT